MRRIFVLLVVAFSIFVPWRRALAVQNFSVSPSTTVFNLGDVATIRIEDPNFFKTNLPGCTSQLTTGYRWAYLNNIGRIGGSTFFDSYGQAYDPGVSGWLTDTSSWPNLTSKITVTSTWGNTNSATTTGKLFVKTTSFFTDNGSNAIYFYCRTATTTFNKTFQADSSGSNPWGLGFKAPLDFIAYASTTGNTTSTALTMDYAYGWPAAIIIFLLVIMVWLLLFRR